MVITNSSTLYTNKFDRLENFDKNYLILNLLLPNIQLERLILIYMRGWYKYE